MLVHEGLEVGMREGLVAGQLLEHLRMIDLIARLRQIL